MLTLKQVKAGASTQQRAMIRPRVEVKAETPSQRQNVVKVARQVIAEHRDVLAALKD